MLLLGEEGEVEESRLLPAALALATLRSVILITDTSEDHRVMAGIKH